MIVKKLIEVVVYKDVVLTENSDTAKTLFDEGMFGLLKENGQVQLSLLETNYLLEKKRIVVLDNRGKEISSESLLKKAQKKEPNFWTRYCVYKDMRDRGYIVKTALKFGADFRVYDRGVKPGEDHAKWILYPVRETEVQSWHEFSAKNRVAHSTKKRLLVGVVDEENDVTYWEIKWTRP